MGLEKQNRTLKKRLQIANAKIEQLQNISEKHKKEMNVNIKEKVKNLESQVKFLKTDKKELKKENKKLKDELDNLKKEKK